MIIAEGARPVSKLPVASVAVTEPKKFILIAKGYPLGISYEEHLL